MTFHRPSLSAFFSGLVLFAAASVPPVQAASKTPSLAPIPPPTDQRVLVSAVDAPNNQVTIVLMANNQKITYTVDDLTRVVVNGNPGALKDIQAGQQVLDYTERDSTSLDNITVGKASPPPVDKKKK